MLHARTNHIGYEKIAWKANHFPCSRLRLKAGPLKEMQERDRVYLYMLPTTAFCTAFGLRRAKSSTAQPLGGWESSRRRTARPLRGRALSIGMRADVRLDGR